MSFLHSPHRCAFVTLAPHTTSEILNTPQLTHPSTTAPIDNSQSLGMPLNAAGLLNVSYAGTVVQNGAAYAADAVAARPTRESWKRSPWLGLSLSLFIWWRQSPFKQCTSTPG